jgi:hypothetical protein
VRVPNWGARMSQAQTFYERHSYDEWPWSLVREWIGHCLRGRYQVPKELPPNLLALVRKFEAIERKSPRARTLIGTFDAIEGNCLKRYAPPVEPRSVGPGDDWPLCT